MQKLHARYQILFFASLLGCSQGTVAKTPPITIPDVPNTPGEAVRQIGQAQVSCSKSEDCNASTGMLLVATQDGAHGCTASLIGSDVLMTNAKCLDGLSLSDGSDCSGKIWVKFPELEGLPAETEECSSVLKTTPYVAGAPDQVEYAFLKMKSAPQRVPLAINFDGFKDQQVFTLYKVDFSQNGKQISGVMGRESCRSVQKSVALPSFDRSEAPLVGVLGCDVLEGNSGAPLVDERGKVHGIIQDASASSYDPSVLQSYLLDGQSESIRLASNLSCMTSPDALPHHTADPLCVSVAASSSTPVALSNLKTILGSELDNERKSFQAEVTSAALSSHVQWGQSDIPMISTLLTNDEASWGSWGVLGISASPVCIANLDSWIQKYSDGILGMKRSAVEPLSLPVKIFRLGIDQSEVPDYRFESLTPVSASLQFDPQEIFHRRMGTFEVHIQRQLGPNQGADEILFSGVLNECRKKN